MWLANQSMMFVKYQNGQSDDIVNFGLEVVFVKIVVFEGIDMICW